MEIAIIVPSPIGQGTFFRGFYLSKYLTKRGHEVTLICSASSSKNLNGYQVNRLRILTFPASKQLFQWLVYQVYACVFCAMIIVRRQYHVIHVFQPVIPSSLFAILVAHSLSLFRNTKLIIDWDDLWGDGGILKEWGKIISGLATIAEERFLSLGDALTVTSQFLMERAQSLGIKKVFIVPNGCELDEPLLKAQARSRLGFSSKSDVLCHVGLTDLSTVHRRLSNDNSMPTIVIIGKTPSYKTRGIGVLSHVRYTGNVPREQVQWYLAAADILLLRTQNEPSELARFPIRLGDYLAAGRPIVTGRVGEIGRLIEQYKCGLLSRPGDDEDFANKIRYLLANRQLWAPMGSRALIAAEAYSWERIVGNLSKAYD